MPLAGRDVLSVGIDVGTSTTQVVFSQLSLHDVARPGQIPRLQVDEKSVLHRSPTHRTPLLGPDEVNAPALAELVRGEYAAAGIRPEQIETGAVIITGETARTRNADAILAALSSQAGDFVVTVAGPDAEAQIAGRGSGVARWSTDHYQQVTTIDVGGGTANAAIFTMGRHLCSSALAVGGRQVEIDPDGRVLRLPPPGRAIAAALGSDLREGATTSLASLRRFTDRMADLLADLADGTAVDIPEVQLTPPLTGTKASTSLFFTGGIGASYYETAPCDTVAQVAAHGDVGPLLADSMRRNPRLQAHTIRQPPETRQATVLGAAGQTVTLSGSTIWADAALLPLRNLPVVRPALSGRGGPVSYADAVRQARARCDLTDDALAATVVDLPQGLGYDELTAVARDIVAHHQHNGGARPLVLVMTQDYAQVLGQTIRAARPDLPLLVVDQVGLGEGDFVDIGLPMLDGRAVPLSIKTLVFYDQHTND